MFFKLRPENCGRFGRKTLYGGELTDIPPQIYRFHFEFDRYPNDELLEVNCVFLGTAKLAEQIKALNPKGISFDEVTCTTSHEYREALGEKELPAFKWFKITGKPGVDHFGISADHQLVVEEPFLVLMKPKIANCQTSIFIKEENVPK